MKRIWTKLVAGLKWLGKVATAPLRSLREPGANGRAARILATLAGLVIILALAWWLNDRLGLAADLRPPASPLAKFWLPLLILLMVIAAWAGGRLWDVMTSEPDTELFPDIERAWQAAMDELARAEINLCDAPLYLVLGQLGGSPRGLIGSSGMTFLVNSVPDDPAAPIHFWASREAIFVTVEGASLLGRYASLILSEEVKDTLGTTNATPASLLLQQGLEVEQSARRLRLLCRLIVRDRLPNCPANGIFLALPFRVTQEESLAVNASLACRRDLSTAREALGVDCSAHVLFGDLERFEGFRELIRSIPEENRGKAIGVEFPLSPDLPASRWPDLIRQSICEFAHAGFSALILGGCDDDPSAKQGRVNEPIYRLLLAVHRGQQEMARIVVRGVAGPEAPLPMLAGVYLLGSGELEADRAFGVEVFRRALQVQDAVSWTPRAVSHDRILMRRSVVVFTAATFWLVFLAAVVVAKLRAFGS